MNILILGGGGREHAFAWKIRQSTLCEKLIIAPGNPGTAQVGTNSTVSLKDFEAICSIVADHKIDLVLIGPEEPLVTGLTDYLEKRFGPNLIVIGPTQLAAQLEGSKAFAKVFMEEFNIPTARYQSFDNTELEKALLYLDQMQTPIVVKADGLAAGKGVSICQTKLEAYTEVQHMLDGKFGDASSTVVLEEFLSGLEFSVFVLTDGFNYKILPVAKDYKKVGLGDSGPNTGGMGAVSPVIFVDETMMQKVEQRIILPTIKGIQSRGYKYHGFIFIGLIEVNGEPFVIEYNCRMGDPETEVVIPRLQSDLVALLAATHDGTLDECMIELDPKTACTVVMVSGGYPGSFNKNKPITIPTSVDENSIVFHAGTALDQNGILVTNGGRVLAVTSKADSLPDALQRSYEVVHQIQFSESYFRSDIGFDIMP